MEESSCPRLGRRRDNEVNIGHESWGGGWGGWGGGQEVYLVTCVHQTLEFMIKEI